MTGRQVFDGRLATSAIPTQACAMPPGFSSTAVARTDRSTAASVPICWPVTPEVSATAGNPLSSQDWDEVLVNSSGTYSVPAATPAAAVSSRMRSAAAAHASPGWALAFPPVPIWPAPPLLRAPPALRGTRRRPLPPGASEPHPARAAAANPAARVTAASRTASRGIGRSPGQRVLISVASPGGQRLDPLISTTQLPRPKLFGGAMAFAHRRRYGPLAPGLTT